MTLPSAQKRKIALRRSFNLKFGRRLGGDNLCLTAFAPAGESTDASESACKKRKRRRKRGAVGRRAGVLFAAIPAQIRELERGLSGEQYDRVELHVGVEGHEIVATAFHQSGKW